MIRVRNRIDLIAGLSVMAVAGFFLVAGTQLRFGTFTRMGAGFFPTILAWTLLALGAVLGARSFPGANSFPGAKSSIVGGEPVSRPGIRPIFLISAGPVVFGLAVTRLGLFLTIVIVTLIARFSIKEAWRVDSFIMPLALAAFCSLVFVKLLGQPIPLWP
ncbi:MAG: tripartite tricarboxylate transporter TctB family protein [Microcystis sp. LE19-4.1E]|nr:tripartite tricarboxylate transporter TctB family protein [Microcystis sp. LE19-4.1E]